MLSKTEAVAQLRQYDHSILSKDRAKELAAPFGVVVFRTRQFTVGQDMVMSGPSHRFRGIGAHELAELIADRLGLTHEEALGIGTRLRRACDAIEQSFSEEPTGR